MIKYWNLTVTFVGFWVAFGFHSAFGQSPAAYTAEQLNDTYRSLTSDDRRALDSLTPDLRTSELTAIRMRLDREQAARIPPFEMDPLLRKAYEYLEDWEERDRETSIALFEAYLEKDPESIFLPDIYAAIGDLYGANRRKGEMVDREKVDKYYRMAHGIWKEAYSVANWGVWVTLATSPLSSFEERREFYDWQLRMVNESSEKDIYPFATMGQCYNGSQYKLSETEIATRFKWLQENIESHALVAEKNLFQASTPEELRIWAKEYPDTMLGRQAAAALEDLNKNEVDEIDKLLAGAGSDAQPSPVVPQSTTQMDAEAVVSSGVTEESEKALPVVDRNVHVLVLSVCSAAILLCVGAHFMIVRRSKDRITPKS